MAQFTIDSDEEVTVSRRARFTNPPYCMVGNGNTNRYGTSLHLIEVLCAFSKAEQFAFLKVIETLECIGDSRKKHNVCHVAMHELSSAEQQKFKSGIASLIRKGIVKRSRREYYMVNPHLILSKEYTDDMTMWNAIA